MKLNVNNLTLKISILCIGLYLHNPTCANAQLLTNSEEIFQEHIRNEAKNCYDELKEQQAAQQASCNAAIQAATIICFSNPLSFKCINANLYANNMCAGILTEFQIVNKCLTAGLP